MAVRPRGRLLTDAAVRWMGADATVRWMGADATVRWMAFKIL